MSDKYYEVFTTIYDKDGKVHHRTILVRRPKIRLSQPPRKPAKP